MILVIDTPDPRKVTADTSGLDEIGALVMFFFLDRMVTRGTVPQRGYVISIGKIYNLPKLGWDSQFSKNKWIDLFDNDLEQIPP